MRSVLIVLCILFVATRLQAQSCSNPGQTPSTAFPVCGTKVFTQVTVPTCGGASLPSPHCPGDPLSDKNPFFYKFTCFTTGTLGFLITPKDLNDDYDWELYDVTGLDPNTIYTNGNLVVGSNWSGEAGLTGASSAGSGLFICAGYGKPLFSKMPTVQAGHDYLLLISHFTDSQSGYTLEFKGGTAVITDTTIPHLAKASANCGGDIIRIKLNKKIKCTSLASDGSDFSITPNAASPLTATGFECNLRFDADSIELKLNGFLPPGTYTLSAKVGTDGNTLLDYCDKPIPTGDAVSFTVTPKLPTPMDSLTAVKCAPNTLQLVFSKPLLCSSIAADGSDFTVNGSYPVNVTAAAGSCSNGLTNVINVSLSKSMQNAGVFTIKLRKGSDGNTVFDECGSETPAGSSLNFVLKDTVNADFTYAIQYDCTTDVVDFLHPGGNGVNSWLWDLDDGQRSTVQNPQGRYTVFNKKNIRLIVSNGFCSDTSTASVMLENDLKADFIANTDNCPEEAVPFTANSTGKISLHAWDFGDGGFGSGAAVTHLFRRPQRETTFTVRYTVTDSFGCSKTAQKPIKVYNSCVVAVPNAFTPDGNKKNDILYPLNAVKADKLEFSVYNRWGQLVFRTNNWKQGWDGTLHGVMQPTGTYVWLLKYIDRDTGKLIEKKGFSILIR